jgi:hypothetical protein
MTPQILMWITVECVAFPCKCAKQYTSTISEADLEFCVKNFEQNHAAGSTILTFSNAQWNVLIPYFGFGNFFRQQLAAKETACIQEM